MKVVVYGICKNEARFVERWVTSMSEADEIVVLDTGSGDDTADRLKARGVKVVTETIVPWRFDRARNRSLELVPEDADICVCTDLDEVFEPGWRKHLEEAWRPGTGQARYRYTWSFTEEGREGVVFWIEKAHRRHGYQWVHPVHEVLKWTGEESPGIMVTAQGVQLNHFPDNTKSRGQYLPLLEMSVEEDPEDDRNMHYLGREYMYRGRWDECIQTLKRHLDMPSARWEDERAASMRYIAKAYRMKGQQEEARKWYLRAILQAPHLREPYMDLAYALYEEKQWEGVLYFTDCALKIVDRPKTYICEAASWGSLPHDLRAMAFFHTGRYSEALKEEEKGAALEPGNDRFLKNIDIIKEKLQEQSGRRQ
ncbi:MAG: glycosyltransferase [Hungatella sp.]|nr:glycosyltransferase [Hungatella sp.]